METNPPKRFLSIRLTEEELKEVYRQCRRSTCSSLTEYARKVLTKKPVIVKTRNQSQDELLEAMIGITKRLDQLGGQAKGQTGQAKDQTGQAEDQTGQAKDQAGQAEEKTDTLLLREIREIKSLIRQLRTKWTR